MEKENNTNYSYRYFIGIINFEISFALVILQQSINIQSAFFYFHSLKSLIYSNYRLAISTFSASCLLLH